MRLTALTLLAGLLACLTNSGSLCGADPAMQQSTYAGNRPPGSRSTSGSIEWNCNSS